MGRISQYEQQQLASSAVGTPGVPLGSINRSTAILGTDIAQAAAGVEGEANRTIMAENAERIRLQREKEAEAKAAEKASQIAQDHVEESYHNLQLDTIAHQYRSQVRDHYAQDPTSDPTNMTTDYKELTMPKLQEYVNNITNPRVKSASTIYMNNMFRGEYNKVEEDAHAQRTSNAGAQFDMAQDALIQSAGYAGNIKDVGELLQKADALETSGRLAKGAMAPNLIQDTKHKIVKQYLDGMFIKPNGNSAVMATIDSGAFKSILTGEDVKHYKDASEAVVARRNRQQEHDQLMEKHDATIQLRSESVQNEVNAPNQTPEQTVATHAKLRDQFLQIGDPVSAQQQQEKIDAIKKEGEAKTKKDAAEALKLEKARKDTYHIGPGAADYKNLQSDMVNVLEHNSASLGGKNKSWFGVPSSASFMKDLDGIQKKAKASFDKGGIDKNQYYHIESSVQHLRQGLQQNKAKPDLGQQLHHGLTHILDFGQHFGGSKKQQNALTGEALTNYNHLRKVYMDGHQGKEPPASVHSWMLEKAKDSAVRKSTQ